MPIKIQLGKLYRAQYSKEILFVEKIVEDKMSFGDAYIVYRTLGEGDWETDITFTTDMGYAQMRWSELK